MEVYSIGFTKKSAAEFFEALKRAGVRRLLDIRLNNTSQLAGFAKRDDLDYLFGAICGGEYVHEPLLAPSPELFEAFKKRKGSWSVYERGFLDLMDARRVEDRVDRTLFATPTVLLCSEPTADHCHRRLVIEYLQDRWGDLSPVHL